MIKNVFLLVFMFGYKGQHMNVLSWLWQLPQNILGLLVVIITRLRNLLTFIFNNIKGEIIVMADDVGDVKRR